MARSSSPNRPVACLSATSSYDLWRSVLVVPAFLVALYTVPRLAAMLVPHPAVSQFVGYLAITPVLVAVYRHSHPGDTVRHLVRHRQFVAVMAMASVTGGAILYRATTALWPEAASELPHDWGPAHTVMGIVSLGVGAAMCEEIAFRGHLQAALEKRFSRSRAVFASSLLFGGAHVLAGYGTAGFIVTAAHGLLLGWLFAVTGSVWPAIGVHGASNSAILGIREAPAVTQALVCAACLYVVGWALLNLRRPSNPDPSSATG